MNRLSLEKSPYLLKHANNPVDWYPWCEEAFKKAKQEDKPIFLSIGYSSCHWCNVMEKESFSDPEVATMLNETFVCIKVDREERPDIDNLYMTFCQMMTGSGGWPLTIIMTPDKKPFFAATYIPKESKYGLPGLIELIPRIRELWNDKSRRGDLVAQGERLIHSLKVHLAQKSEGSIGIEDADACFEQMLGLYDEEHGGFGTAPKFPVPHRIIFLLRYFKLRGEKAALIMAEKTLTAMRNGGIFDQLGYGMHRYSTDAFWMVPHFEKMLYDQALCILAYLEAFEATGNKFYKKTAEELLEYVMTNLRSNEGCFFTSEDADSEGEEGKFYLWTEEQMKNILEEDDYQLAVRSYLGKLKVGVEGLGYVLHVAQDIKSLASEYGLQESEMEIRLEKIRKKMLEERSKRIRPSRDDKVLTDWNGLMIAALSRAYVVTGNNAYLKYARDAAEFLLSRMKAKDGSLMHRYRDGEAAIRGFLEDYAFLCWGLVELYEACFDVKYLREAIRLKEYAIKNFWDEAGGGFYQTEKDAEISYRIKEAQDGAMPSGNSVMAAVIWQLCRITGNLEDMKYVEKMGEAFSSGVKSSPYQYSYLLTATTLLEINFREIVLVFNKDYEEEASQFLHEIRKYYIPNKVIILRKIEGNRADIDDISTFVREYDMKNGKAAVYICTNFACQLPITTAGEIPKALQA
jgi:uncharacterized protein YyaL (SSP411 family)